MALITNTVDEFWKSLELLGDILRSSSRFQNLIVTSRSKCVIPSRCLTGYKSESNDDSMRDIFAYWLIGSFVLTHNGSQRSMIVEQSNHKLSWKGPSCGQFWSSDLEIRERVLPSCWVRWCPKNSTHVMVDIQLVTVNQHQQMTIDISNWQSNKCVLQWLECLGVDAGLESNYQWVHCDDNQGS